MGQDALGGCFQQSELEPLSEFASEGYLMKSCIQKGKEDMLDKEQETLEAEIYINQEKVPAIGGLVNVQ